MLHDPIEQAVTEAAARGSVKVTPIKLTPIRSPLLPTKDYSSLVKFLERKS